MLLVGLFVFGRKACHFSGTGLNGQGPLKTETRSVGDFHGVELAIAGELEISVSDRYSVEVQGQENILPVLKTRVENGILKIDFEENVDGYESLRIKVSAPSFDDITLSGSGTIRATSTLTANRLEVSLPGSGEIVLTQLDAGTVDCEVGGSGSVELGGKTNELQASMSGSGEVKAKDLAANDCKADLSGSGSISCNAAQTLKASISGSGNVSYAGNPTVEQQVSGSGEVKRM